jgi:hypothetical protein
MTTITIETRPAASRTPVFGVAAVEAARLIRHPAFLVGLLLTSLQLVFPVFSEEEWSGQGYFNATTANVWVCAGTLITAACVAGRDRWLRDVELFPATPVTPGGRVRNGLRTHRTERSSPAGPPCWGSRPCGSAPPSHVPDPRRSRARASGSHRLGGGKRRRPPGCRRPHAGPCDVPESRSSASLVAAPTVSGVQGNATKRRTNVSNSKHARIIGTACAALVVLVACGPAKTPSLVPNVEPLDEPVGRHSHLPGPDEVELCFRRVPIPRC